MATDHADCIFCRIVSGSAYCRKIAESSKSLAFLDIAPAGRGHTLVVPKSHSQDIFDIPDDELMDVIALTKQVALTLDKKLGADGSSIFQMNRTEGGQTVFHFHVHVVPRWQNDTLIDPWIEKLADDEILEEMWKEIVS